MSYPSDALRLANKIIKEHGGTPQTQLTRGIRKSPWKCPISLTIRNGIGTHKPILTLDTFMEIGIERYAIGKGASGFITRFDKGKYPQYIWTGDMNRQQP